MEFWSQHQIQLLKDNYLIFTHEELGLIVGRDTISVKNKCKSLKLLKKVFRHPVNDNYFDTWSQNTAYILGFLTADGNLAKDRSQIEIYLHYQDVEILRFIQSEICPNNPIKEKIDKRSGTKFGQLRFSSKKIYNKLIELGVTPQKTGKENYPTNLPSEFKFDYLRGLFDGDGSIYYSPESADKYKRNDWYICSASKKFLENLKLSILPNTGNIHSKKNGIHYWEICKTTDLRSLASLMYVGSNFSLKRKRDKMMLV